MAKTKIDDLPKGAEEMDAEEQKAAKGGATTGEFATLQAARLASSTLAAASVADRTTVVDKTGTLAESPTLDTSIRQTIKR